MLHESILDQSNWDMIQCVVAGDCSCKFNFDLGAWSSKNLSRKGNQSVLDF